MGKVSKSTKRFSKNHLSNEIKSRKLRQKIKFREKKTWTSRKSPEELAAEQSASREEAEDDEREPQDSEYKGDVDGFLEKGFFEALEKEDADDNDDESHDEENEDEEDDDDIVDPKKHKKDLERLKTEQPEFYKYLVENDAGLLDFDEEDEDQEKEEEEGQTEDDGKVEAEGPKVVTLSMIETWSKVLTAGNSFKTLRDFVRAFESACHLDDIDNTRGKDAVKKKAKETRSFKYLIGSGAVFERLMRVCVTKAHIFFGTYLGMKEMESSDPRKLNPQSSARWKRLSPVAKAYVKALTGFLETLTDPAMIHLLLRHAERMMCYVRPFPKSARKLLKVGLRVFGMVEDTRVQGFLLIRRLALEMPYPFIESCYKGMYLTYVRQTKFTNPNVIAGQHFMAQCVVELFGLDLNVAYEHAFVYIRQLAIQLRSALTSTAQKSAETSQVISSWQFVNSVKLWVRMLSAYPGKDQLGPLVYPLVQVAMGTMTHLNGPKYLPLRLQLTAALIRLGVHAGVYLPLAPVLLEPLARQDLLKTSAKPGAQPVDLSCAIKLSKTVLETRMYQQAALEETLKLLLLYYGSIAYSPAFPDLIVPALLHLRAFAKATSVARFRRQAKDVMDRLERQAAFISRIRSAGGRTPQDDMPLNALRPSQGGHVGPLEAAFVESSSMLGGDLAELLKAHSAKVAAGAKEEAEEGEEEEEEGKERGSEPRWKEARRQRRREQRAAGKKARPDEDESEASNDEERDEEEEEDAGAGRKKRRRSEKNKGTRGNGQKEANVDVGGEDTVEALRFSSDEED